MRNGRECPGGRPQPAAPPGPRPALSALSSGMMSRGIKQRDVWPAKNPAQIHSSGTAGHQRAISHVIGGCSKIPAISRYLTRHNRLISNAIAADPSPLTQRTTDAATPYGSPSDGKVARGREILLDPDASLT